MIPYPLYATISTTASVNRCISRLSPLQPATSIPRPVW